MKLKIIKDVISKFNLSWGKEIEGVLIHAGTILEVEEINDLCGSFVQATILGNITCANKKGECSIHDISDWEITFKKFYDDNESGGSSRWLVSPGTVQVFIRGLLNK